jgi:hypothetical protein
MKTNSIVDDRTYQENEILKKIRRDILKSAKKGDFYCYWDITNLSHTLVGDIVAKLEKEGKKVNSKGPNFKIIRW